MQNWKDTLNELRTNATTLAEANPEVIKAFSSLNQSLHKSRHLDAKTRELIALAVAVTTRCEGCIASHASSARKAGATKEEVAEALGTAITLNAGAAYVYSTKVMEAFEQFDG
ncbi:carboxymuconolactone decarboxylase family protein [Enterobacter sp. DTU_2021_1002640_1_SI_PRY_ASU_LCPMC_013]|uniref:carboxymuconolactone decarboxylase family protein n=1 Tax=Enterobacter sp. DTU_2021_1002640_1_SI_PRY_ASU_LCPMC_013 TaxID=3077940 RepID=UPI0028EFAE0C|nr:carboxymuconolactone decarboxylase family protein [Enterobacter sp. DTU_2021_1002640_1_SI_PRY_ASU_LCPMC_013]WNU99061.1 carboxymuconolactone decarboxylase family protein [Enterobacter sp. DTU_2021_1002640_1_SI_PRY_ASU_LCPMC_013]